MLAYTKGTYQKLDKVFTGTCEEVEKLWDEYQAVISPFPTKDVVCCRRGNNWIYYFRPYGGRMINDKIAMIGWNKDDTYSLYL